MGTNYKILNYRVIYSLIKLQNINTRVSAAAVKSDTGQVTFILNKFKPSPFKKVIYSVMIYYLTRKTLFLKKSCNFVE